MKVGPDTYPQPGGLEGLLYKHVQCGRWTVAKDVETPLFYQDKGDQICPSNKMNSRVEI